MTAIVTISKNTYNSGKENAVDLDSLENGVEYLICSIQYDTQVEMQLFYSMSPMEFKDRRHQINWLPASGDMSTFYNEDLGWGVALRKQDYLGMWYVTKIG